MSEHKEDDTPRPPPPPDVPARIHLHAPQIVGISLIALLPLAALLGVFGEATEQVTASGSEVELDVEYPARLRYGMAGTIEVRVRNRSERPLDRVVVEFEKGYISGFSSVVFAPDAQGAYAVELLSLRPGETRLVSAQLEANRYWRRTGTITAAAGDGATAVDLVTIVFP